MRILSWNVNGIRAAMKKDFIKSIEKIGPDIICLQETKAQEEQVHEALAELTFLGFKLYANSAVKKGYSGTAVITKIEPENVEFDMGIDKHDQEGRVIAAEFPDFILVTVYNPNSGSELKRLTYRQNWDADFLSYLKELEKKKPLLICGDLNVAHKEIDLARPKENYNKSAGYMQEEIDGMDNIIAAGFIDTFRHLKPEEIKYSWWSFRAQARPKNIGWRIDYFLASPQIIDNISEVEILNEVMGSDHCPVMVAIKF